MLAVLEWIELQSQVIASIVTAAMARMGVVEDRI